MRVVLVRAVLALAGLLVLASAFVAWRLSAQETIAWTTLPATTCTPLDQLPSGRIFHVDPSRGSVQGDGSAARPFANLQALVDAGQVSAHERALFRSELNLAAVMHRLPVPGTRDRPQALIGDGDTVLIEGNVCLARSRGELLPDSGWQGISIFDGRWQDVTVRCNLVLPNSQHGIALYGMAGALVEHNVVAGSINGRPSWIAIMPAKDGRQPADVMVRHNSATAFINAVNGSPDAQTAEAMREALRVNRGDDVLTRRLRQPIDGVQLEGNHWLVQAQDGPPVPPDARFTREEIAPVSFPISLEEARRRFPLPAACARG